MSLRGRAAADFRNNLKKDNDDVLFTFEDLQEITVKGKITRADMSQDPAGVLFYNSRTVATVSLTYEDEAGEVQTLPALTDLTIIETTDVSGEAVKSYCRARHYDRVLGFVTVECEELIEDAE